MSSNGEITFLTHEVGSLAKPPWLVKTSAGKPLEESDVEHAKTWGEKLGVDGQVAEPFLEQRVRTAERHPERELRPAGELLERGGELADAPGLGAREERLLEDDELRVERVDLRLENARRDRRRLDAGPVRKCVRRGQRDQARARHLGDEAAVQRLGQRRRRRRRARSAIERVRVEEACERARLEPVGGIDDRPEDVLPAEHPVCEEVEADCLLDGDEVAEIALDLFVDRLPARPAAIEVARRLHELLRAGVDAWCECLQLRLLTTNAPA